MICRWCSSFHSSAKWIWRARRPRRQARAAPRPCFGPCKPAAPDFHAASPRQLWLQHAGSAGLLRRLAACAAARCTAHAPAAEAGPRRAAHPPQLRAGAPPAQALVQVQHGDVGEVGHARDGLQEPEALQRAPGVQLVQALRRPGAHPRPRTRARELPRVGAASRDAATAMRIAAPLHMGASSLSLKPLDMGACRWALRPTRACAHPAQQDVEALDEPGRLDPLRP